MNTTTELFRLLPIDWQTIGAIATFLVVICSFITLFFYRKKEREQIRREIGEKIIEPLVKELENIIKNTQNYCKIMGWKWKEFKNDSLSFRISNSLRDEIERFDEKLEKELYHSEENRKKLSNLISKEIKKELLQLSDLRNSTFKNLIFQEKINPEFTEYILNITYQLPIEIINFFQLVFQEKTFLKYKKELIKRLRKFSISGGEIKEKEEFRICIDGASYEEINQLINDNVFENISRSLLMKVNQDSALKEYIEVCRTISSDAIKLKEKLDTFRKEIT
jgi:hypothetical protein